MNEYIGAPKKCDICNAAISAAFVDGRLKGAMHWACMCLACHESKGCGLGTGDGQLYHVNLSGAFVKTAG